MNKCLTIVCFATGIILLAPQSTSFAADGCEKKIEARGADADIAYGIEVGQSGQYCMDSSIYVARGGFILAEGREFKSSSDAILRIKSSDVSIDLQNQSLDAELGNLRGIESTCSVRRPCVRIEIKNGEVRSASSYGIVFADIFRAPAFASVYSDFQGRVFINDYMTSLANKLFSERTDVFEKIRGNIPISRDVIEGVHVSAAVANLSKIKFTPDTVAVGIQGASNLIRGNTIEVEDGQAGVYLFGPNQVIENNIIIFKGHPAAPSSAPIKLHMADGSIIRNNLIIIQGLTGPHPQSAISLVDSKDVVIENNQFYGTDMVWSDWGGSSAKESGNVMLRIRPLLVNKQPGVH